MMTLRYRVLFWTAIAVLALGLMACGSGSEPQDVTFEIAVADRELVGDTTTYVATQGDTVTLNITSDEPGTVHVHGYDVEEETGDDGSVSMTFVADATGQFSIEMHVGGHDETAACQTDAEGVVLNVDTQPGGHAGEYVVSVATENFELTQESGNHWHLSADGELVGMYYEPSVEVMLGEGAHELVVTLSDADHCELPISETVMVGADEAGDSTEEASDDGGHTHDEATISLGVLQIRPR